MFSIRTILSTLAVTALCVSVVSAQAPGGVQMTPEMQSRMKAWAKFRDTHKNISSLQQTLFGLSELEKDPKTKLTKSQAKTILGVLQPWRKKPVMTDAQALKLNKQITGTLTQSQLKKIVAAPRIGQRSGGMRRPPEGAPGAGTRGDRPRQFDPSKFPMPKEYNPLNPDTIAQERMRTMAKQRMNELTKLLTARAK